MQIQRSNLSGLLLLTPPRIFPDDRGFFVETYRRNEWTEIGLPPFVQDNHSRSTRGVVRGIHFNLSEGGQGKLVRCSSGVIWDVAVDLRLDSPTFGQWQGFELSDANHAQLYVPPGFGHGFCVLSDLADVNYKLSSYYHPDTEFGLAWDDPTVGVDWRTTEPILSKRDCSNPQLDELRVRLQAHALHR